MNQHKALWWLQSFRARRGRSPLGGRIPQRGQGQCLGSLWGHHASKTQRRTRGGRITRHTHTHRYSRTYNTGEWTNKQESCESYDMNLQSFSVPARAGKWLQTELIHSSSVWSAVNQTAGLIFTQFITAALPVTVPQTRTAATQQVLLKRFFSPLPFLTHTHAWKTVL